MERAIQRLKYDGCRPLARPLAGIAASTPPEAMAGCLGVAVPLHSNRQRQRGFNQAELLLAELRPALGLLPAPGWLERSLDTPPQVGLDRSHRWRNVAGAFVWRGQSLGERPVLVVDDVTTTGATLVACALALREAGAQTVMGFTVARVSL